MRLPAISMGRSHLKNKFRKDRIDNEKNLTFTDRTSMCFVLAARRNSENIETAGTIGQTASEEESPAITEESETLDEVQKTATHSKRRMLIQPIEKS